MIHLKKQFGFTLVELAVVLAIVGVLAVGSTTLFTEQKTNVERDMSQAKLTTVKMALLRFVEKNNFLPCPDTNVQGESGFGLENRFNVMANLDACSEHSGTIPFEMLDLPLTDVQDSQHNLLHYAVTQGVTVASDIANCPVNSACFFNHNTRPAFNVTTEPVSGRLGAKNLELCAGTNCTGQNLLGRGIVAMVLAYNYRATSSGVSAEEAENRDGDTTFIQLSAPTESFDDLLISISGHELKRSEKLTYKENKVVGKKMQGNDLDNMGDTSVGGTGTNIGTDDALWDRVNQTFDFGADAADKKIVLTYNTYIVGAWDQPGTTNVNVTSDTATITISEDNQNYSNAEGESNYVVKEYKYDHKDASNPFDGVVEVTFVAGSLNPNITGETYWLIDTYNAAGEVTPMMVTEGLTYTTYQPYWNDTQELILTADAYGVIDLEFAVGTTATVETIDFTDIELMYYAAPPPIPNFPSVSYIDGITQTNGLE